MFQPFNKFSFVRFSLFLILGILNYRLAPSPLLYIIGLTCVIHILYWSFFFRRQNHFFQRHAIYTGLLAFSFCFLLGWVSAYKEDSRNVDFHYSLFLEQTDAFTAILSSPPKETEKTFSFEAQITSLQTDKIWQASTGNVMLYLAKDSTSKILDYGDHLIVKGSIDEIQTPKNPFQFNYKSYLEDQHIYGQSYAVSGSWKRISSANGSLIFSLSYQVAAYLGQIIKKHLPDSAAQSIALALSLGNKQELSNELKDAYASAGAMHVLAVSGLHVGILYMLISFILKSWKQHKSRKWIYLFISLLVLWSFAFITGLSPSVMRAASMFSFICLAECLNRKTNIYNTLASTCFILLIINPNFIYAVGFQLSYLAVLGIVFFQPRIYKLFYISNYLLDKIWAITAVSLAAQLATLPLTLFYFKQFPSYFLLANLAVIPSATIILISCLILFATGSIPIISDSLGWVLNEFIKLLNIFIEALQKLPSSQLAISGLSTHQLALLYLSLFLVALCIAQKKARFFYLATFCMLLFSFSIMYNSYHRYTIEEEIFFHDRKGFHHATKTKNTLDVITDAKSVSDFQYNLLPYLQYFNWQEESKKSNQMPAPKRLHGFICYRNSEGINVIWDQKTKIKAFKKPVKIKNLIISNDAVSTLEEIERFFKAENIILAANNSYFTLNKLSRKFESANINYRNLDKEGYYQIKH